MSVVYKTLFEVKLMHEFYLTSKDGKSVFELVNQPDRINYLLDQFSNNMPSINNDLEFIFPEESKEIYKSAYLKLLSTYSGCKVAIRVDPKTLADTSLVFDPFVPLPENFNINIQLKKKSAFIDRYTNSPTNPAFPAQNFFSNQTIFGVKAFPFLTSAVPAFDGARAYEQGDIASFGANDTREFYNDGTTDKWESITGSNFTNENDQLLVPLRFYYSFINQTNITAATFILKDKNANEIKSINLSGSDSLQRVLLDFSDVADTIDVQQTFLFPDAVFQMEVSANNGYTKSHSLLFSDPLYSRENWGLINIQTKAMDPLYNLLANDGYLITRKIPPGIWNDAPVFEIPIKSKFAFWRFINEKGKELKLAASLTDYLFKEDKILLSKRPRALADGYFLLQKEGSTSTVYVPNPISYDLTKDSKARLCLDIMVPASDLFPVV